MSKTVSNIFNIPPTMSFTDILARSLVEETRGAPEQLAKYLILLPTRRGCRNVQEAFLRQSRDKPIMLPRLHPIGDVDGEELMISDNASTLDNIPPAMPPIKRQILLAKLISSMPNYSKTPDSNMRLATALGQLMDQVHTENLDMADLPQLVSYESLADQWKITTKFLEILSVAWPEILKSNGMIDGADRRNRLINALQKHWQNSPPNYPIIAAGSTGSIPATSGLLKTIAGLPQGKIILPGLDQNMSDTAWGFVEDGHPQNTLKELIENIDVPRNDVKIWPFAKDVSEEKQAKEKFISHVMAPPEYTHEWQKVTLNSTQKSHLISGLSHTQLLECDTPQDEANTIAILMRESIETPAKTTALITPNRYLARRVATICKRWGIEVDDSGGQPLNETSIGIFLKSILQCAYSNMAPIALLGLLKNDLSKGGGVKNFRSNVRDLDLRLMRGLKPLAGFNGLQSQYKTKLEDKHNPHKPDENNIEFLKHIEKLFEPLNKFSNTQQYKFNDILKAHITVAENLSTNNDFKGAEILWRGEAGEAAANFLSGLYQHTHDIPDCTLKDYLSILDHFMQSIGVRPQYGTHPRLMILGQLEARLIQTDRIILSGLNEGIWPPDPGHDPWMSRPMRDQFGLPKPERAITLAAHDFAQAFCGKEVFLTRAHREDGAPTVPARWLQRMETFMKAIEIDPQIMRQAPHAQYAKALDKVDIVTPLDRPAPTPPVEARPNYLSVTKIETWLKDPYAIYAGQILKLHALSPIEKEVDAMERGTILHEILEKFNAKHPKEILDENKNDFIQITKDVLTQNNFDEAQWNFWLPRMKRLAEHYIPHEKKWRENARLGKTEIKGKVEITEGLNSAFTLSGVADRIDYTLPHGIAIIDYKSGGSYSDKKMISGDTPQLPLEAYIATQGGFKDSGIHDTDVNYIGYWKLTGSTDPVKETAIRDDNKLEQAIEATRAGLHNLIKTYEDKNIAYFAIPNLDNAPRFNDYEHLERVKEWTALNENEDDSMEYGS